jgi:hypothetical protein
MLYKEDWDQSRKRLEAFWNGEIVDRCCIAVTSAARGREDEYWRWKNLPRMYGWADPEAIVKRSRALFAASWFGGESFPGIWLNLGPSGHAGFFKGVRYHVNDDSVWFTPTVGDDYGALQFDSASELFRLTMEMGRYYVQDSRGDYFVSVPDTAGNLDALAHLRGSEDLLMDMAMEHEGIPLALQELQQAWCRAMDAVHAMTCEVNDGGGMIYWLKCWAPGFLGQLQLDISVMISPDLYQQYGVPELEEQSRHLEYPLYHLDGAQQVRHLDHLLSVERIRAIQWTSVAGQQGPSYYMEALKRIQASGKSLLISVSDVCEVEPLLRNLSSKGLYLVLDAADQDQAETLVKMAARLTHD